MKILKNIMFLTVLSSFVTIISCGGDDDNGGGSSDADRFVGTWSATSVFLDDVDVTDPSYLSTTAIFNNDGSYIVQNGSPAFTSTGGAWEVTSSTDNSVIINVDGVTMTATFSNEDMTVLLTFTAPGEAIGARLSEASGLSGGYEFTFAKQ